jgi:hypothetical protein
MIPSFDIYLVMRVTTDAEQSQISTLLASSGLYAAGLDSRKIIYCDTEEGVAHIVKHLQPNIHVERAERIIEMVASTVDRIIKIGRCAPAAAINVQYDDHEESHASMHAQHPVGKGAQFAVITQLIESGKLEVADTFVKCSLNTHR